MDMSYCANCGKDTGHKRALGFGDILCFRRDWRTLAHSTYFYPKRCIVCGFK